MLKIINPVPLEDSFMLDPQRNGQHFEGPPS